MKLQTAFNSYQVDLENPLDISIPLKRGGTVNAFHLPDPSFETVQAGNFIGNVNQGGSCNVENIHLSAHGNGTHTECVGHISKEHHYLKDILKQYHFLALLASVDLTESEEGHVISEASIRRALPSTESIFQALIIRTKPNDDTKKDRIYSGTNPPFLTVEAVQAIKQAGVQHLLIDLPSVDHEDDPLLKAHHAFFGYPNELDSNRTITELVYVPHEITDGFYLLNMQVLSLESDASPSHPVLFKLE
jgi:arylformamidase